MDSFFIGSLWALWLGILTSISPCPLATNITAVSYIGRQVGSTRSVLLSGLFYTLGRMATYGILGAVVITSLLSIPEVSNALQKYMNKLLGPLLILVGMVLLDLLSVKMPQFGFLKDVHTGNHKGGFLSAGLLGMVFALAFCPTSAALFFGSLIPLSLKHESNIALPLLYGIGTALPVFIFSILIAYSFHLVGKVFNILTYVEVWMRRVTGIVFIAVGIYFVLAYIFRVV